MPYSNGNYTFRSRIWHNFQIGSSAGINNCIRWIQMRCSHSLDKNCFVQNSCSLKLVPIKTRNPTLIPVRTSVHLFVSRAFTNFTTLFCTFVISKVWFVLLLSSAARSTRHQPQMIFIQWYTRSTRSDCSNTFCTKRNDKYTASGNIYRQHADVQWIENCVWRYLRFSMTFASLLSSCTPCTYVSHK